MHDEHPFAREGGAPRAGVVVGLQGAQLGKAGRVTAADDLPLGPDVPEGEQLGALRILDVETAEFVQRGIVGGKDARQIPNVRPPFCSQSATVRISVAPQRPNRNG